MVTQCPWGRWVGAAGLLEMYRSLMNLFDANLEASVCVGTPPAAETCAPADVTLPFEKRLLLRASVAPATEKTLRFLWSLMPQRERYVTDAAAVNLRPTGPGTYVVEVTCQNHVSSVSSPELALRLVERVTNLNGINVLGPVLVARPTRLRAVYTTGSNLTFSWNFGDGSDPVLITDGPEVSHTFTRVREYWVKVVAYNIFSRAEFETNVFAMEQPCSKPELRLHRYTEARFNEDVYVEAAVNTSCPISAKVRYSWTVLNATGSHVVFEHSGGALSRKDLLLPAGTLPVGRYLLSLKARMMPTAVYAVENATLAVVPSPVSFSIAGGSWRTIGPSAIVILETKVYPPDLSDYRITWKCEELNDADADCFTHPVPSSLAKRSSRTLRFLASSLNSKSAFLFTATLTLGNASSHVAQQVLNASGTGPRSRLIEVSCRSCDYERRARSHEKVVLTALCQDCDSNEELYFEWSLWSLHHGDDHCYGRIGSTQVHLDNSSAQIGRSPHRRAHDIQLALRHVGSRSPAPLFPPFPDFANGTGSAKNVHFEPTEDHRFTRLGKRQRSNVPKGPRRIDSRLGIVPADSRSGSVLRKIFGYSGKRVEVGGFQSSFHHSAWLVLQPGTLMAKCSYAVHVKVRRKGSNDTVGEARERIMVGDGTSGGQCNIQPRTGVALETLFTVNCSIWKGGRKPHAYIISYGLSPAGPWRQLYRGSRSTSSFWLPPGMASQNNSVHIRMVIQDADGFRLCLPQTSVLRVLNSMDLSVMKNKTSHLSPIIARLFGDQQYQAALNKLQVLITVLRTLEAPKSTLHTYQLDFFRSVWRFAIRTLRNSESFPVNTVQAFIQTWNVIVEPRFPGEEHDLIAASQLLQFFVQDVQTSRPSTSGQFEVVVQELVTALGHLIKSAQTLSLHTWHIFYERIRNIEDVIKNFIEDNYVSREVLHFSSAWLELSVFDVSVDVQCSASSVIAVFHPDTDTILHNVTPPNSLGALPRQPTVCLVYRFPFFAFSPQPPLLNRQFPSKASTFALNPSAMTLEQGPYVVNFPRQNMPHKKDFVLRPGTVHVHKLKNLKDPSHSHLYIRVETGYFADALQVFLSQGTEQLVTSRGIRVHQMFNVTEIYIDKETLNDHNDCQLTIARKPERIGNWKLTYGSSSLTYQLEGFGQECLLFFPEKDEWDTHGCSVTDATTVRSVQCKCQGGPPIISMISGTLKLQLVELPAYKIFGKQINWLVISFLVATMAAYTLAVWWLCSGDKRVVRGGPRGGHVFALKTARSTARHLYLITVQTGPFFNAGTSAAVSMILHGETGDSEVIKLADSCQVLQRCSTVAFLAGTNIALGNLASVEVWHDNSGEFPSWFLEDLTVVHWNTQATWHFVFDEWFSTSSKDGRIEREAFASENSPAMLRTLQRSLIHALSDHHLWYSTVTMKSCSSFSRGQRLLMCLSTVLSSGCTECTSHLLHRC
ncbi:polycystic kidney disease protein 1-like 1 [Dermacentor silvarum]|uniref:polycystic kidney disease protein 1-like 1 n=1 Tax=Dermacentor silvarum TaxID=543639 RepID=UPI0021013089|nr:polycystic kidney disease protein 1-like 1 [Dermacentor silvarum]